MNDIVLNSLAAALMLVAAGISLFQWWRHVNRVRTARLRSQGYRLIHALQAYSAWIDAQRDLPFTAHSLDELTSPEPLTRARAIKRESFPSLAPHMVRLLQAHSHVIEYLWQQSLLRLSQGAAWRPVHEDQPYRQLRGAQEELIDEMIVQCRELIGDARTPWHATGSDFAFSNHGLGRGPASRA
jgi:hypothetical protein